MTSTSGPHPIRRAHSLISKLQRPHIPAFQTTKFSLHGDLPVRNQHGHDDDEPDNEHHTHVAAGLQELFFDLIFVASVIQLAAFLKHNTTWDGVYQAYIVFNILWLTWLHMTFLANRFKAPLFAKVGEFLYMGSTLVMAFESFAGDDHEVGLFHRAFFIAFVTNRMVLLTMYCKIMIDIPSTRDQVRIHIAMLGASVLAAIAGIAADKKAAGLSVSIIILLIEYALYPLAHVLVHETKQLQTDVHHFNERIELWSILILGESIISLVVFPPEIGQHDNELYVTELLAFLVVYLLLQIQTLTQPTALEADFDEHALDLSFTNACLYGFLTVPLTFGIFLFGTGLKLMVTYGLGYENAKKWDTQHAWVMTGGLALGLLFTVFRQMTHEWGHNVFNRWWGRPLIYTVKICISVGLAPLAVLVESSKVKDSSGDYKYVRDGVSPSEFMGYVLLFVAILLAIEPFCLEDENDVTEYGVYTREVEKALEALSSKENAETKTKEVNRWHWAYRKVMQKDQWDSVCSFAVQAVKKKHSRSKVRAIGDARTLRYTGPIGLALRAKLREVWVGDVLNEELAIQEFAKIILDGVREDPVIRRATMDAMDLSTNEAFSSRLARATQSKFSITQV
eukprot:m.193378 g.193378  ORF g.193378 m.193378 type:complete len:622 (+) comp15183_c0_seq2:72-1937(+)